MAQELYLHACIYVRTKIIRASASCHIDLTYICTVGCPRRSRSSPTSKRVTEAAPHVSLSISSFAVNLQHGTGARATPHHRPSAAVREYTPLYFSLSAKVSPGSSGELGYTWRENVGRHVTKRIASGPPCYRLFPRQLGTVTWRDVHHDKHFVGGGVLRRTSLGCGAQY